MTSIAPLLAISGGPEADPIAGLDAKWQAAAIKTEYFVYDESQADEELLEAFRARQRQVCEQRACATSEVVLGGFSRGARLAALLAAGEGASALLGLSYPFHKHGAPRQRHGLAVLQACSLPTLIVQGTRDAHGTRSEVGGYGPLPGCVTIHWLEDGNHRWRARQKTGIRSDALLRSAADTTIAFLRRSLASAVHDD